MNNLEFKEPYSKGQLRYLLNMKETYFKTWMQTLEPEILKVDKSYNKQCSILTPKIFRFLLAEYGLEDSAEINKGIQDYRRGLSKNRNETL